MELIAQGAEAIIQRNDTVILKHRIPKTYRHPSIDNALRKFRTRREAKILQELTKLNVPAPRMLALDDKTMSISMDHIPGQKLKDVLDSNPDAFARELGRKIAILHQNHIIHGDLTTSNLIVHDTDKRIYFIDFGLSQFSDREEDKAVDLHLLQRALDSKHSVIAKECFTAVLEEYKNNYDDASVVLERLRVVELRGRNRAKKGS